jgi:hypothetical protein
MESDKQKKCAICMQSRSWEKVDHGRKWIMGESGLWTLNSVTT